jgi:hypothetical protein
MIESVKNMKLDYSVTSSAISKLLLKCLDNKEYYCITNYNEVCCNGWTALFNQVLEVDKLRRMYDESLKTGLEDMLTALPSVNCEESCNPVIGQYLATLQGIFKQIQAAYYQISAAYAKIAPYVTGCVPPSSSSSSSGPSGEGWYCVKPVSGGEKAVKKFSKTPKWELWIVYDGNYGTDDAAFAACCAACTPVGWYCVTPKFGGSGFESPTSLDGLWPVGSNTRCKSFAGAPDTNKWTVNSGPYPSGLDGSRVCESSCPTSSSSSSSSSMSSSSSSSGM